MACKSSSSDNMRRHMNQQAAYGLVDLLVGEPLGEQMQRDQEGGISLPVSDVECDVPRGLFCKPGLSSDSLRDLRHAPRRHASLEPLGTGRASHLSENDFYFLSEAVVSVGHRNSAERPA